MRLNAFDRIFPERVNEMGRPPFLGLHQSTKTGHINQRIQTAGNAKLDWDKKTVPVSLPVSHRPSLCPAVSVAVPVTHCDKVTE